MKKHLLSVILLMGAVALVGCQSYHLRGVVIEGTSPGVWVVAKNDPRLQPADAGEIAPLPGASVQFTIDPMAMDPTKLPAVTTDERGRFDVPVEKAGAGFLQYELGIVCRAVGAKSVVDLIDVPPADKRLVIVLTPGKDTYQPPTDFTRETLDLGNKLQRQ